MLRVAFLGSQFAGQLSQRSLDGVEVVLVGTSPLRFAAEVLKLAPDVLVLDLGEFNERADEHIREIVAASRAEITIVTYSFARRALLRSLQGASVRVLQSPITLDVLHAHLAPFLVRQSLRPARPQKENLSVMPSTNPPPAAPAPPKFSRQQLGSLMEISSDLKCECPNHLAQVVERLQSFEAYSKDCVSSDPADAALHAMLYAVTAEARAQMEKALEALVVHEKLSV